MGVRQGLALAMAGMALGLCGGAAAAGPAETAPYVRIAELEIDPAQLGAYKDILATEQAASVRTEPGVVMLHSVAIAEHPNQIRLLEVYASRATYEAHVKSPHFLRYKAATASMVVSLKLIETVPILLCAKTGDCR